MHGGDRSSSQSIDIICISSDHLQPRDLWQSQADRAPLLAVEKACEEYLDVGLPEVTHLTAEQRGTAAVNEAIWRKQKESEVAAAVNEAIRCDQVQSAIGSHQEAIRR